MYKLYCKIQMIKKRHKSRLFGACALLFGSLSNSVDEEY